MTLSRYAPVRYRSREEYQHLYQRKYFELNRSEIVKKRRERRKRQRLNPQT